jgi:hypothetical protein
MFFDSEEDQKWIEEQKEMYNEESNELSEGEFSEAELFEELSDNELDKDVDNEYQLGDMELQAKFANAETVDLNEIVNTYIENNTFTDIDQLPAAVKSTKSLKNAPDVAADCWSLFDIHPEISAALRLLQFNAPTPIQQQTLVHAFRHRDVVGCAETVVSLNSGLWKNAGFWHPHLGLHFKITIY